MPGLTNSAGVPVLGDGYAALTVDTNGGVALSGALADGTALSRSAGQNPGLSRTGEWPLYLPLYNGGGSIWGWLAFATNQAGRDAAGALSWIKPAGVGGKYYPLGLTNEMAIEAAPYVPPPGATNRTIAITTGWLVLEGIDLGAPLVNEFYLTPSNRVMDLSLSNRLNLTLTLSSGLFAGKIRMPQTGLTNSFGGALLQTERFGAGFFLGTSQGGRVWLGPAPY